MLAPRARNLTLTPHDTLAGIGRVSTAHPHVEGELVGVAYRTQAYFSAGGQGNFLSEKAVRSEWPMTETRLCWGPTRVPTWASSHEQHTSKERTTQQRPVSRAREYHGVTTFLSGNEAGGRARGRNLGSAWADISWLVSHRAFCFVFCFLRLPASLPDQAKFFFFFALHVFGIFRLQGQHLLTFLHSGPIISHALRRLGCHTIPPWEGVEDAIQGVQGCLSCGIGQ